MRRKHRSTAQNRRRRGIAAALLTAALLAATLSGNAAGRAPRAPAANPSVITFWNEVTVATVVVDAGKANAEAFIWYGFEQAAVYNAVVGITGRYEPYKWNPVAPENASPQAAAASAAFHLLMNYFPGSATRLNTAYATSLALIPDGPPKQKGIRFGQRAAERIITLRTNDGRNADLPFTVPPGPGVWRPTPPDFFPFFNTWTSQMKPLLIRSMSQFRPGPPPAMTSEKYEDEFEEVKELGELSSTERGKARTQTALFFSDIGVGPLQGALRDLVTRRHMDISRSARLFAAVDMSIADAMGSSWDSKFHYHFWRPITAIRLANTDGNPETDPQSNWVPLIVTPPYPDYTSGLSAVVGALSQSLTRVLGTDRIDLFITSAAAQETRHYVSASQINRDVINARIWSGIHFRTADVVGNNQGKKVANFALDHYFHANGDDDNNNN